MKTPVGTVAWISSPSTSKVQGVTAKPPPPQKKLVLQRVKINRIVYPAHIDSSDKSNLQTQRCWHFSPIRLTWRRWSSLHNEPFLIALFVPASSVLWHARARHAGTSCPTDLFRQPLTVGQLHVITLYLYCKHKITMILENICPENYDCFITLNTCATFH